ncbi:CHAT domain-containing protein, partial [Ornithinicoccus halotolerans]|uniref:CHAT domain-containing protein n=1 Tax=Ornithinicoccus halotolerans TaxID=1748220 RepID=UPI001294EF9E
RQAELARDRAPAATALSPEQEALLEADVVHVAAHGTHQQENPMFASVLLHDGPLYVYDLQHTGVGAAHVVLGACEVGRSTVRPGEEALGLTAGLLGLGAQCVVAGMGQVPDDVSLAAMGRYHAALAKGRPSDEAMAEAVEATDPLAAAFQVAGAAWRAP